MSLLFLCFMILPRLFRATELEHANGSPSSFTYVRRFAKFNEVTNTNGSSLSGNIVEMTEFIDKAAKSIDTREFPSSFTIITKVRPLADPLAELQQPATARRADASFTNRTPNKQNHVKSSGGTFSLINGMIVFSRKNNTDDYNIDSSTKSTTKRTTTTTTRAPEASVPQSTDSFSSDKTTGKLVDEVSQRSSSKEKLSFTFLPTPAWSIGNKTVSKLDFDSEIESSVRSKDAAKRLPTVRVDKDTVFVPSASFHNGTILYNKLSIEDFLKDHEENVTLYDFPEEPQTTVEPPNVPLSHMEILYPGFRDVVKQKPSQIIIQNIFVTPNKEPVIETNTLSQDQMDRLPNGLLQLQNATNVFVMGYQTTTPFNDSSTEREQAESTQRPVTTSLGPAAPISSVMSTVEPQYNPTTTPPTTLIENDDSTSNLPPTASEASTEASVVVASQISLIPDTHLYNTTLSESTTVVLQTHPLLTTTTSPVTTEWSYNNEDQFMPTTVLVETESTTHLLQTSTTIDNVTMLFSDTIGPEATTVASSENTFLLNHSLYYNRSSTTESSAMTVPLEIDPQFVNTLVDQLLTDDRQSSVTLPTVSKATTLHDIQQPSDEPQKISTDNESAEYIRDQSTTKNPTTASLITVVDSTTASYTTEASEPTTVTLQTVPTTQDSNRNATAIAAETTTPTTAQTWKSANTTKDKSVPSTTPASLSTSSTSTEASSTLALTSLVKTTVPNKYPTRNSSLAAMILAHTAALMAGKPSPLLTKYPAADYRLNVSSNSSTTVSNTTHTKPDSAPTSPSYVAPQNEKVVTRAKTANGSQVDEVSSALRLSTTPATAVVTTMGTSKATTSTTSTTTQRLMTLAILTTPTTATTSVPITDSTTTVKTIATVDAGVYMEPDLDYSSLVFNSTESDLNVTDFDHQDYSDDDRLDFTNDTRDDTTSLPESSVEGNLQWVTQLSAIPPGTAEDSVRFVSTEAATSVETVSDNLAASVLPTTGQITASSTAVIEMEENETTAASRPQITMPTSTVTTPVPHAELTNHFSCGDSSSGTDVNFVNPSFPGPDVNKGRCTFQLIVQSRHICQLRIDFNDTRMLLPRQGFCLDQYLSVTGAILIPGVETFCGRNPDQHFYLELTESLNLGPRIVEFHVATAAEGYLYRYGLRIRQIDCNLRSEIRAPRGCFQYYTQGSGLIKSFNFEGGQYYNNANYRICVRTMPRGCAIALVAPEGGFGIHKVNSRKVPMNRSGVGSRVCRRDYLWIPSGVKEEQSLSLAQDRYCGAKLSSLHGDSRTKPVIARLSSSIYSMEFRSGTPRKFNALSHGPGFRLSYTQLTHCPPGEISAILHRASTSKIAGSAGPVNSSLQPSDADKDILRFAALEDISEDYYDDDPEAYKPTQSSASNVTFTEHLNQLIKASLWISKVARNVTHRID